jgi:hypothetical protein
VEFYLAVAHSIVNQLQIVAKEIELPPIPIVIKSLLTKAFLFLACDLKYTSQTTLKFQFSHKQLVLVNGPCFYRGLLFFIYLSNNFLLSPFIIA